MSDDLDFMPADSAGDDDSEAPKEASKAKSKSRDKSRDKSDKPELGAPGERAELPTWNRSRRKRKANAKAEAADDGFQRGVRKAGQQFLDTPKLVIGGLAILTVAIAAGVMIDKRGKAADAEATRSLKAATAAVVRSAVIPPEEQQEESSPRFPVYPSEEARDEAVAAAIAKAKGSGRDGVVADALLVEAAYAMRRGNFDAAKSGYDAFLSEADDDHPLRYVAVEGKGLALEAGGDLDGALAAFESLADQPTDLHRPMALYHQGRVLEALERTDDAIAVYQQFFAEFPPSKSTMATPLVRDRIEELDPEFSARLAAPARSPLQMPGTP